jgi:asparagine synthase (glutamine-hydrolysing)
MCGINGIFEKSQTTDLSKSIEKMNTLLKHRGPDGDGVYIKDNIGLGHTRLAIIDLSEEANQPFIINNQYTMVYNGECYNYRELKTDLERKGHNFRTSSDTEVVLRLYIEYGIEFTKKINGIFAIAIHDQIKNRVVLSRDRLGVKPLYFHQSERSIIFSSEIKPILSQTKQFEVNTRELPNYFSYRYVPGDETLFKDIFMLPKSTSMIINAEGKTTTHQYWDLNIDQNNTLSQEDAYDQFNSLFRSSIKKQMVSDAPLGVFLSGGIDSAAIASTAVDYTEKLDTYTMDLNTKHDESTRAKEIADMVGANHHTLKIDKNDFYLYEKAILSLEEPLGDSIIAPTYLLAKEVSKSKKVVLSGEGADEILNGYVHHLVLLNEDKYLKHIPRSLLQLSGKALRHSPQSFIELMFPYPTKLGTSGKLKVAKHLESIDKGFNSYDSLANLYHDDFKESFNINFNNNVIKDFFETSKRSFSKTLSQVDLMFWNEKYTLARLDKLTMAHGLEARVPFLDHELVEFMLTLPKDMIQKMTRQKLPLRNYLTKQKKLNAEIINRKKQAFFLPPEESYNQRKYKEWIASLINKKTLNNDNIFKAETILSLRDNPAKSLLEHKKLLNIALYMQWKTSFQGFSRENV